MVAIVLSSFRSDIHFASKGAELTLEKNRRYKYSAPDTAAETFRKLASAGVNVTAANGCSLRDQFGLIFWVKPDKVEAAAKALGA